MQNAHVSGTRLCGHLPVVGSTRIRASLCFIVSGLSTFAGAAATSAEAGLALAFAAAFGFAAFFAGAFLTVLAFFAAFFLAFFAIALEPSFPGKRYTEAAFDCE